MNGSAADYVFFVLSGYVIVLPLTRRRPELQNCYPKQLIRPYLPEWASVLIAVVLIVAIKRTAADGQSWWINSQPTTVVGGDIVREVTLLFGASSINCPLWSLQWEIWFSLLFPLFNVLATRWSRGWVAKLVVLMLVSTVGSIIQVDALFYLPMFAFGAILAVEGYRLRAYTRSWGWMRWALAAVMAIPMMNPAWNTRA